MRIQPNIHKLFCELEEVEEEEKAEQERISAAEAQRLQATVDVMVARIAQLTGGKS